MNKKKIISLQDVKKLAKLANLQPTPQQIKELSKQLADTLNYVELLEKIKTKGVKPTSQVTGLENVFREDKVGQSLSQKEALANAKSVYQGYFKIKSIFK